MCMYVGTLISFFVYEPSYTFLHIRFISNDLLRAFHGATITMLRVHQMPSDFVRKTNVGGKWRWPYLAADRIDCAAETEAILTRRYAIITIRTIVGE